MSNLISLAFSVLFKATSYETEFDAQLLNYGLVTVSAKMAHCDGEFLKYSLEDRPAADFETSCGVWCREMRQYMPSKVDIAYTQSKSDGTQFVIFTSNTSLTVAGSVTGDAGAKSIVAFRGTTILDIINMRRNFFFRFSVNTLCANCEVHDGFWRNFLALRPALVASIHPNCRKGNLLFTGMSMGAPLALLGAFQVITLYSEMVKGVVTLGGPRVANHALAKKILETITVSSDAGEESVGTVGFAYARDPVPHCPPRMFGYFSSLNRLFHTMNKYGFTVIITGYRDDNPIMEEPSDFDLGDTLYYDKVYVNVPTDFGGDKQFGSSVSSYSVADHGGYYRFAGKALCGYEMTDPFLKQSTIAEIFFL